jgi:hypothetical protein
VDDLRLAAMILHSVACVVTIAYAVALRRSRARQDAFALAIVWCATFLSARAGESIRHLLPPPGDVPYYGFRNRALLVVECALYFAWPLGVAAWIRWTFVRARSWWIVGAWLLATGIPAVTYPLIRGSSWFRLAAVVHIVAFVFEISAIVKWTKRREKPQPWHGVAIATSWVSTMPAISFLVSPESAESYHTWFLGAVVGLHLWVIAMIGGSKWQ